MRSGGDVAAAMLALGTTFKMKYFEQQSGAAAIGNAHGHTNRQMKDDGKGAARRPEVKGFPTVVQDMLSELSNRDQHIAAVQLAVAAALQEPRRPGVLSSVAAVFDAAKTHVLGSRSGSDRMREPVLMPNVRPTVSPVADASMAPGARFASCEQDFLLPLVFGESDATGEISTVDNGTRVSTGSRSGAAELSMHLFAVAGLPLDRNVHPIRLRRQSLQADRSRSEQQHRRAIRLGSPFDLGHAIDQACSDGEPEAAF